MLANPVIFMPWKLAAYSTVLFYELTMTNPTDLVFFFNIWLDKIQFVITSFPPHHLVPRLEKSMKDESTDLQVLAAVWHQPEAAPLKNEKAGLFCCFHIHLLLRNPIKLWKKVTFPFSVMTHGKRPLSGRRWEPLMRLVRWFWPKRKSYWLTEPALRLLHSVNHVWTLFFVSLFCSGHRWSPISRMLFVECVPSFNFITVGLTVRQQGE